MIGNIYTPARRSSSAFRQLNESRLEEKKKVWNRRSQSRSGSKQPLSAYDSLDDPNSLANRQTEKVTLNVGGTVFITFKDTLVRVPCTRLYYLMKTPCENLHPAEYDTETGVYFFDRHPGLFEHIVNYYRTGQLHVPRDICWPLFENELNYWGLDHTHLESCCWMVYRHHTDNENTLKALDEEDKNEKLDPRVGDNTLGKWDRNMCKLWTLIDDPMSSIPSKCIAFLSLTLILVSVAIFCLETHKLFREEKGKKVFNITLSNGETITRTEIITEPLEFLFYIETVCIIWFCIEFFVRLISCPSKATFLKSPLNIVDFLAILPYFVDLYKISSNSTGFLRIVRICRVFRVFKLTRHLTGLKILWHTLHASMKELFILAIFMCLGVVIFASLIFYAERLFEDSDDNPETDFIDIPHGFWWALVTMTTLGYGDMVPKTFSGQIVGSLCALCGLLTIALPVPVIVSNFSLYYSHYQAKVKLPKNHFKDKDGSSASPGNSGFNSGSQTLAGSPIHQRFSEIVEAPEEDHNPSHKSLFVELEREDSFDEPPPNGPSDYGGASEYRVPVGRRGRRPVSYTDGELPNIFPSQSQQHIIANDVRQSENHLSKYPRKQSAPLEVKMRDLIPGPPETNYNIHYAPQRYSAPISPFEPVISVENHINQSHGDDMELAGKQTMSQSFLPYMDQNHHQTSLDSTSIKLVPSSSSCNNIKNIHHKPSKAPLPTEASSDISSKSQQANNTSSNNRGKSKQQNRKSTTQYVEVECEV